MLEARVVVCASVAGEIVHPLPKTQEMAVLAFFVDQSLQLQKTQVRQAEAAPVAASSPRYGNWTGFEGSLKLAKCRAPRDDIVFGKTKPTACTTILYPALLYDFMYFHPRDKTEVLTGHKRAPETKKTSPVHQHRSLSFAPVAHVLLLPSPHSTVVLQFLHNIGNLFLLQRRVC
mmetsp:Transcript_17401/g.40406  ORF Transcript_17401/g.40406 Transcript_17401/m.40406 type:complete len:174 (+) Transcript_17401:506-1027(+)